jgi:hypothetical protein
MKPNTEQLESIKNILGSVTNYRETYTELYDHILTALEVLPNNDSFPCALHRIIEIELGGKRGIAKIEATYKKIATKEVFKRYLAYFVGYLLSPFLLVAIALTVLAYKLFTKSFEELGWLRVICMWLNVIPISVTKIIMAKAKRDGLYNKLSIIRTIYSWVAAFPIYLSLALQLIIYLISLVVSLNFNQYLYINLAMFFLNSFTVLAICRLCRDELKLRLAI